MNESKLEFKDIYNEFQPKILRYLKRIVGESDAEDLTQEVFLKVNQALKNFRGDSKTTTWLYRIATNTALDRLRSPSFRRTVQAGTSEDYPGKGEAEIVDMNVWTGETKPLVEQQLFRNEMNQCIREFVEKLPENYRTVLVLSEIEQLKNSQIAEILGVSLDTVKIRLHRSREKLIRELAAHCDSYWVEGNEFVPDFKSWFEDLRKTA
jgi:RNA polymerase sigma-70 factor (ECF subfamily)